jgi:hypothetical protein
MFRSSRVDIEGQRHVEQSARRVIIIGVVGLCIVVATLTVTRSQPAQDQPTSLPATNLSAADNRGALPRAAPGFAHAAVASNPQAPDVPE